MDVKNLLQEIRDNCSAVIKQDSPRGDALWQEFLGVHPADIADFFTDIDKESFEQLFVKLPKHLKLSVFQQLSEQQKKLCLSFMTEQEKIDALNKLPADELTDFFDTVSDEDLKKYLALLHKTQREQVVSLLKFHPESAGGIMDTEVVTLLEGFTVEKSIKLLQRLKLRSDIHRQLYVTDNRHRLVGHILLQDLVLQEPTKKIESFMQPNELVAYADQDREEITQGMVHYHLMNVPVVSRDNIFLGVIPSDTLVDVLVEEAHEDVQKMAALAPMKQTYFETPFLKFLWSRSSILVVLLLAESFSTTMMEAHEATLKYGSLLFYINMLISTGGNSSSQTSAVVIQGLASGEIRNSNIMRFLKREFCMATMLGLILGGAAFARSYMHSGDLSEGIIVSLTVGLIVLVSVILGSCIPLFLKRLKLDPAFSAGPFLATVMDIFGILIYCYVSKLILAY